MKHAIVLASLGLWLHVSALTGAADVVPGQVDDFEDGTTSGWQHGHPNPNAPRVIEDGGPGGAGDAYLQVSSHGAPGIGGKLIMFNDQDRWTGSYGDDALSDPIVRLDVELNNLGDEPLTLWFSFHGEYAFDEGGTDFTSVETGGFSLAPGSGWQQASFSLLPEDLTSRHNVSKVLDNVSLVWLFHNASDPIHPAPPVEAILGLDNLTAIGSAVELLPGDYNGNGRVEQADLDLVLLNWGASFEALPADWINQRPDEGIVDQAELDGVLLNWGNTTQGTLTVPEPAAWLLLASAAGCVAGVGRRLRGSASAPAPARLR